MEKIVILTFMLLSINGYGNKRVSITIDDVPNTTIFEKDGFNSSLLKKLDSMKIPVAIFINESKVFYKKNIIENIKLLQKWASKPYITVGNHSYSHARYSEYGIEKYKEEILKGEFLTRKFAEIYDKSLTYFRFPYNDIGTDSLQHAQVGEYLTSKGYVIAPFTIESSDWVFNYLYKYYLDQEDLEKAALVGEQYIQNTLDLFDFYDSVGVAQYNRNIDQIYLCHDNRLNADYLDLLVEQLKQKDYSFISMETAMLDEIYAQEDIYYLKWGVSWIYRWMQKENRRPLMMKEPDLVDVYEEFERIQKLKE